jgi:hypothetical protein
MKWECTRANLRSTRLKEIMMPEKILQPQVLQEILSLYKKPRYLEIGVSEGETFHALKAKKKVAVDPRFKFDLDKAAHANPEAAYHQVTSDAYFVQLDEDELFDVIYIDGLHTFDQTLRDFTSALAHLDTGGIIVIDDVRPNSHFAAMRDLATLMTLRSRGVAPGGAWMGDVYRLVFFIETFFPAYSYRTIRNNHGQLVVWRQTRKPVPAPTVESISRLPYEAVHLHNASYNLEPFEVILKTLRDYVAGHRKKKNT